MKLVIGLCALGVVVLILVGLIAAIENGGDE